MPRFSRIHGCVTFLVVGLLLLTSLAPAYGRYALEDFDLRDTSHFNWVLFLGSMLGLLLGGVVAPCLVGWATYKWLHKRYPDYSAESLPSLAFACAASWMSPWMPSFSSWEFFSYAYYVAILIAGAAMGYYAFRQPRPAEEEPLGYLAAAPLAASGYNDLYSAYGLLT